MACTFRTAIFVSSPRSLAHIFTSRSIAPSLAPSLHPNNTTTTTTTTTITAAMVNKKKRDRPDVQELIDRPWCYYCERDFDDQKVLISHQKAKHFKCDKCNRRLNTAGGLQVHLQQVHKETLTAVDNAIEGRQNVEPEVFGMMGIPDELVEAHKQRILNEFFKQEADRRALTGNPPPGQGEPNAKKRKMETPEELKARLAEHRAKRAAERQAEKEGKVPPKSTSNTPDPTQSKVASGGRVSRYHPKMTTPPLTYLTRIPCRNLRPRSMVRTPLCHNSLHRIQVCHCSPRSDLGSHRPSRPTSLGNGLRTWLHPPSLRHRLYPTRLHPSCRQPALQ